MEKHRNENSDKIKQIKLIMIFGHALIIIITAIFMACFTIKKNDMVLKSKVSDLTYALNVQMKLNINTYLSKLESVSTLVFGTDEAVSYYSSAENADRYEALNTEKLISDKLYDLCIMENYVDFFIVYSDDHTVGKVSNGTTDLYGDDLYNDMAQNVTRNRSKDGWSTGYNDDFRRIYYVKRINDNALLVASFYTSELETVFVRPDDMRDTAVRLVNEDHYIMYSSENEETGSKLPAEILDRIGDSSSVSYIDDDYLITVNPCADNWYVICSAPTQIILAERNIVIRYTIIITVVTSVVAMILGTLLSIYVTDPVNRIVTKLNTQANIDRLTGIYNKLSFEENAEYMLKNAGESERHAVILLDVDNFKGVNDDLGHAYGDKVLADIGNILRLTFNSSDCIGRIGGDEFGVLLNIPANRQTDFLTLINEKCHALCDAFHNNYTGSGGDYKISASIGVAVFPDDGKTFAELYRCADAALYSSKHKGKDTFTIYSDVKESDENA
ncbi:MAG: GGDEF domain-containing protein [Oscillospiraceae bacterium]|nr:GGDEF domain-containing protein [Oscillospiraceae bacterium]